MSAYLDCYKKSKHLLSSLVIYLIKWIVYKYFDISFKIDMGSMSARIFLVFFHLKYIDIVDVAKTNKRKRGFEIEMQ